MAGRDDQILTVGGLNRAVRLQLEHSWGDLRIVGEIGDLSRAASGHIYFTLNDEVEQAQLRVVMFKSDVRRSRAPFENGARVCLRGTLTLFEPRGTFQFLARSALPAGEGDLTAQFKRLLEKLRLEGLLEPGRKRPLPLLPRCIGLVTSEQGAAMHDVIRVAQGRCPVRIVVAPCSVQGAEAPRSIVVALRAVQRVPELDVIILARGGGGAEDLWAFNDESVARAIVAARVPVVTGIGHEVDTTIADLVADLRAATPSNAAEVVVPEQRVLNEQLDHRLRRLARGLESRIARERLRMSRLTNKLRHPRQLLASNRKRHDLLEERLVRALRRRLSRDQATLAAQRRRLLPRDPRARLRSQRAAFERARARLASIRPALVSDARRQIHSANSTLRNAASTQLLHKRHDFAALLGRLQALSPLSVLARGYAIAFSERTGQALRSAREAVVGERLRLRLHEGSVTAQVVAASATEQEVGTLPELHEPLPKPEP